MENSMSVEVRLPTLLRRHADNQATVSVEPGKLSEVFDLLGEKYPQLGEQLRTDDGELHKFMNVYLGDDDVRFLQKLDTEVPDGSTVTILPAVAGGA
jgi:sulfur-carrier protein